MHLTIHHQVILLTGTLHGQVLNGIDAGTINISLLTDGYGSETTWDIKDESGNVVGSGGPYSNNTQINETAIVSAELVIIHIYMILMVMDVLY